MTDSPHGPSDSRPVLTGSRRGRRSAFPPAVVLGVVAIVALVAAGGWYWLQSREGPSPETLPGAATDSVTIPEVDEPFVLPSLDASDRVVRRLAAGVMAHPRLMEWLVSDDLIRRFVRAVVDVSRGSTPVPALEMLIPEEPLTVRRSEEGLIMAPASYDRYDALSELFDSIDPEDAGQAYERLLPLFREAYQEMGIAEGTFDEAMAGAVANLLAVEVSGGPFELREAVDRYVYADERIEALNPAQKHLYRMGPENARKVQEKLEIIARELDLLPGPEPG